MGTDGSSPVKAACGQCDDREPHWSPDGGRIVFQSSLNAQFDVCVVNADGTGRMSLTTGPGYDMWPQWAPVSKRQ